MPRQEVYNCCQGDYVHRKCHAPPHPDSMSLFGSNALPFPVGHKFRQLRIAILRHPESTVMRSVTRSFVPPLPSNCRKGRHQRSQQRCQETTCSPSIQIAMDCLRCPKGFRKRRRWQLIVRRRQQKARSFEQEKEYDSEYRMNHSMLSRTWMEGLSSGMSSMLSRSLSALEGLDRLDSCA
jgi:hypothetical protein